MSGSYEVVVGIPSYAQSETIDHVVAIAGQGLKRYFPGLNSIIVNCDNTPTNGTKDRFLSAEIPTDIHRKYIPIQGSISEQKKSYYNLIQFCKQSEAKIMVVLDACQQSMTLEWIRNLGYPINNGHDYVAPLYARHHFDGTITNHLCYPLIYALMGIDIREPIGQDFAFSPKLCSYWLKQKWNRETLYNGADISLSLNAISENFRICQAGLGSKVSAICIDDMCRRFNEIVYILFSTLISHRSRWFPRRTNKNGEYIGQENVRNIECYGINDTKNEIEPHHISMSDLKQECRREFENHRNLLKKYLNPYAYKHITDEMSMDLYGVNTMLWSQIVYRFLYLFERAVESEKVALISALKPLYLMRCLSFNYKTYNYSVYFAEEEVKKQAMIFQSQKPYLIGLYTSDNVCQGSTLSPTQ